MHAKSSRVRLTSVFLAALLGTTLCVLGCGGGGGAGTTTEPAETGDSAPVDPAPIDNEPSDPDPTDTDPIEVDFPVVPDVTTAESGSVRHFTIPTTDCANLTASPIVVGDWLVYPNHEHGKNCSGNSRYERILFGYHLKNGELYMLYEGGAGEAPLTYDADNDVLYWTTTFGGTVHLLDPATFELRRKTNVGTTADSAGAVLDDTFYFGNVNTPHDVCQDPVNPECGALIALDPSGDVVHQLDTDDGFRAWIGTSVTTDGSSLYFGSAGQTVGEKSGDETEYLYGCSVIKTDRSLNVLASFDPGDLACFQQPFDGADLDSVGGEVVPDENGVWVQYVRPNEEGLRSSLYRLDLELRQQCRLQFEYEPQTQSVGFYTGPTVDRDGNAYVVVNVPDEASTRRGLLLRVTPECETTTLAEAPGAWAYGSPTLADDEYVLFATDGRLQVLTLDGAVAQEYALGTNARVLTTPVLHEGVVYVVQEDATLNVIEATGLAGYGTAPWPRYRHDNQGRAALD